MFSSTQGAEFWTFLLPSKEPGRQVSAGFLGVTSIVKPSQFDQAVVGNLARQIVESVKENPHSSAASKLRAALR